MGTSRVTLRAGEGGQERLPSGTGRLLAGVAWLVLLLGLWLWGGSGPDGGVAAGTAGPATGDMAAAGRPPRTEAAAVAADGADGAAPERLDIPGLGVRAPVVARGLDGDGVLKPAGRAGSVAWYAVGAAPGASGVALMAGAVGTGATGLAVGQEIRVVRADGEAVAFTVEDVRAVGREGAGVRDGFDVRDVFDVRRVSASAAGEGRAGQGGRAGLRLVTFGGTSGTMSAPTSGACTAPVVVSAYANGS
ncbi:class F sortase [Streptomyces sp. NPDC086080]|uniref:class F sortase n=1 Tax=Streptomyces sp. NPDC086080 TaxID=3365748 RepID=UPI0037D7B404